MNDQKLNTHVAVILTKEQERALLALQKFPLLPASLITTRFPFCRFTDLASNTIIYFCLFFSFVCLELHHLFAFMTG